MNWDDFLYWIGRGAKHANLRLVREHLDYEFYVSQLADERTEVKDRHQAAKHYLLRGWTEGKDPNREFSTKEYLRENSDVRLAGLNPFVHFLKYGKNEGRTWRPSATLAPDQDLKSLGPRDTKPFSASSTPTEFDLEFYRRNNFDLAQSSVDLWMHYLATGWKEGRDPSPDFSTNYYLENNEDVRRAGVNPFLHYLTYGRREGRQAKPSSLPVLDFRHDADNPWQGYDEVRAFAANHQEDNEPDQSVLEFCHSAIGTDLADTARRVSLLAVKSRIDVSVIIPCFNQVVYTLECLLSLVAMRDDEEPDAYRFEVIVVDNASTETTYEDISAIKNLTYVRNSTNKGFGEACNIGARQARGEYLLFLNNDAQVAPDAILQLLTTIKSDPTIGIVGPKILSFDGRLQEAGCLLNEAGSATLIGFGRNHRIARFNYRRPVDYVSAVALMISKESFLEHGGFDPLYAPGYCEDSDLCLKVRANGKQVVYVPEAIVAHHLSKTSLAMGGQEEKVRLATRNAQRFAARWQSRLSDSDIRMIAFYLPQYHPIPENDEWWGDGFTDWRNLSKAKPIYFGHRQPREPADFGYYDLRAVEVMDAQAQLAEKYGIHGFCYYYYSFKGRRLLELPLERLLSTGRPALPYCLCWANENWTRRWDGLDNDVLIGQEYSDESDLIVIKDLVRYFDQPLYIRVNGRPIVLVYRVGNLPLFHRTSEIWRNYARSCGVGEICIALVESFELSSSPRDPHDFGCDITVEFPPHEMAKDNAIQVQKIDPGYSCEIHDYRRLAERYIARDEPGFKRIRSLLVGWDNTPRRRQGSSVLEYATPGAFQAWAEWTIRRTREQNVGDERLIFINSWNEWCEGSYLEPDTFYGHAYLQALHNALTKGQ